MGEKMKKHIWLCDYERLWIKLSLLAILSGYFILQGSTLPVLVDNQIIKFLFVSDAQGDKTLYNIAISYFAAYIFYVIQIYYMERNKTLKFLNATKSNMRNFIRQIDIFLFVWWQFVDVDLSSETIKNVNIRKIYFNEIEDKDNIFTSDKKDLGETVKRAKEENQEMVNNLNFSKCDDKVIQLFLDIDIVKIINRLYQLMLSAELMINTDATIKETFDSNEIVKVKSVINKMQRIYGFKEVNRFEITKDNNKIKERDELDRQMEKLILENIDYFQNISDEYTKSL